MDPKAKTWPVARSQDAWKIRASRNTAISFAVVSVLFFLYGVYRVLRASLG
jgi:hypothetical protein